MRMSALMKQPVIYVLTHDSIYVGEDGPTHQPVEHLAVLRAIPGLALYRPADAEEANAVWQLALERTEGPSALAMSRQNLPVFEKADPDWRETIKTGAYIVKKGSKEGRLDGVIIATGSEVPLALDAAKLAEAKGKNIQVVSMPCYCTFGKQPREIQEAIVPHGTRVFVAEAGIAMNWTALANPEDILSIGRFGESGPAGKVAAYLGFTAEALCEKIMAEPAARCCC
jgi:transketolase